MTAISCVGTICLKGTCHRERSLYLAIRQERKDLSIFVTGISQYGRSPFPISSCLYNRIHDHLHSQHQWTCVQLPPRDFTALSQSSSTILHFNDDKSHITSIAWNCSQLNQRIPIRTWKRPEHEKTALRVPRRWLTSIHTLASRSATQRPNLSSNTKFRKGGILGPIAAVQRQATALSYLHHRFICH